MIRRQTGRLNGGKKRAKKGAPQGMKDALSNCAARCAQESFPCASRFESRQQPITMQATPAT